jgi:hypothetical protein
MGQNGAAFHWGVQELMGDTEKVVWVNFSTLS